MPSRTDAPWPRRVTRGNVTVKVYRARNRMATLGHQFVVIWKVAGETKRKTFTDEATAMSEAAFKAEQLDAGRTDAANLSVVDRDELMAARDLAGAVPVLSALREWQAARALTEGNPTMLHRHYRGLATKAEALRFWGLRP